MCCSALSLWPTWKNTNRITNILAVMTMRNCSGLTNSGLPFEAELIPSCRTELHFCQTHSWQVDQSVGAIIDPINKLAHGQIWDIASQSPAWGQTCWKQPQIHRSHLHRVEAHTAEAVNAPGEGPDWTRSLFVPNVHLLAACWKHIVLLVMVEPCEDCLRGRRIMFTRI